MAVLGYQIVGKEQQAPRPEGESDRLIDEVRKFFDDPEQWMRAENTHLGGLTPHEAVERGGEEAVRDILRQARFIGVS